MLGFSLADGKAAWRVDAGDTIIGAVAVREGRAYASCRDGNIYAANASDGGAVAKLAVGSPMVCSPAVAGGSLYVTTTEGKAFCLDRQGGKVRWSMVLTPEKEIFSSPALSGARLFVGTRARGVMALEERSEAGVARVVKPWMGPGGDAGRTGCADDRGLPHIEGDTADLKWADSDPGKVPAARRVIACGNRVYAVAEKEERHAVMVVDAGTGRLLNAPSVKGKVLGMVATSEGVLVQGWDGDGPQTATLGPDGAEIPAFRLLKGDSVTVMGPDSLFLYRPAAIQDRPKYGILFPGEISGLPVAAHNLLFGAAKGRSSQLYCLSDADGKALWSMNLRTSPVQGPSVSGDRVFVPCAGKGDVKGFVEARKIVDGALLWRQPLDEPAASYVVAAGDWAAVAMGDKVAVFRASDGKARDPIPVGGPAVAPALCRDVLVIAGQERIAAYDLSSSEWIWNYKDQDNIGTATGQPVVAGEVIWVGTTKKGLVAIGVPEKGKE